MRGEHEMIVDFKNGEQVVFDKDDLDCSELTVKGHACKMIEVWMQKADVRPELYRIDRYNAVRMSDVVSVRVVPEVTPVIPAR